MSTDTALLQDPKNHPDNANLPNVNEPATILGVTVSFLVRAMIEKWSARRHVLSLSGTRHLHIELPIMVPHQGTSLGLG